MKSFVFSFCFVLALTSLVFAESAQFKVNYVLTDNTLYPNGEIPGTLYYKYNTEAPKSSAVRFEHEFTVNGGKTTIVELEDFSAGRVFKICGTTCEAYPLARTPQQWWYKSGDAKKSDDIDGFSHYTRSVSDYGISDLWLKDENAPSNTLFVKKLIFNTGRTLYFTDGYSTTVPEDKFDPNAGDVTCSTESCRTYMDLVFVLDSSASVGASNWNTMVDFVKKVVQQTDISAESGAVAVTGFGGKTCNRLESQCQGDWHGALVDDGTSSWHSLPGAIVLAGAFDVYRNNRFQKRCGYTLRKEGDVYYYDKFYPTDSVNLCRGVYFGYSGYSSYSGYSYRDLDEDYAFYNNGFTEVHNRCGQNFINCTYSGETFISKTYVELTYAQMDDIQSKIQSSVVYSNGDTCQALGLIKAIETLKKNDRARENNGLVPQRVIIVLTDGDDHCAAMTKQYADILRTEYNAIIIEVSITLKHNYDKELLKGIASKFNGDPAYFDVSDFSGLKEHIDQMVTAVCQTSYADVPGKCDSKCNGFCGCAGECFCPTCDSKLNNMCHTFSCEVQDNKTAGCVDVPTVCNDDKRCTTDTCDNATGCVFTETVCDDGLKTCQSSKCSEDLQGQCEDVVNNPDDCPEYPYPCYAAYCEPENPASDSSSGCRYEYLCVGALPVEYNQDGSYKSGCYEYMCENTSGKCGKIDICEQMSDSNKCESFKCDTTAGMCVKSGDKVTCPAENACRPQSKCNPTTGTCDTIEITPDNCKAAFIAEGLKHVGSSGSDWFVDDSAVSTFYTCGEHVCQVDATGSETTLYTNGHCVFTRGDNDTCGACSGLMAGQPSFESCKKAALDLHDQHPDTCYSSKCKAKNADESECEITPKVCEHKSCMIATCNQTTFQCEYEWNADMEELKRQVTACSEIQCINEVLQVVDISTSKCVGENSSIVPVCQDYDHCDAKAGCVYKPKCVKSKNCTTMTCDMTQNKCVEEDVVCKQSNNICYEYKCTESIDKCEIYVKPIEEACRGVDTNLCHRLTCSVALNECVNDPLPFPNETDKCHIYTCENSTGSWSVRDKCDDNDICTVDSCTLYDGSCTNFKRDCHELNMTGFGACFSRACSKNRKGGCFRKVFENSYFDECGNCLRGYSAGDSGITDSEAAECKKALTFQEEAAVIGAGVLAAIIVACVIGAIAVSTAGTLATKELIKRARAARDSGAHDNPLFEEDGEELENPTFVGNE